MSKRTETLASSLSEHVVPLRENEPTASDVPDELRSRFDEAAVVGLGGGPHGTQEFHEHRATLVRLLVERFDARAIAFEAPFHQFRRIDERVSAGEDGARSILAGMDGYREPSRSPSCSTGWRRSTPTDRRKVAYTSTASIRRSSRTPPSGSLRTWIEPASRSIGRSVRISTR